MLKNEIVILILAVFFIFTGKAYCEDVLSWKACIAEAQKNHPDLISAQESIKQSEASKKITASGAFPQVDASTGASRDFSQTLASGKKKRSTSNSFDYGVSGTQLIFDGAKIKNEVNSATQDIKAAQYSYKFTSSEVRLRLRTAFVGLLKAQELLVTAQQIFEIRRSNLELITLRYESGMEHKGALLTAEANLAQAEFEIAQNKRALGLARRQLNKEMGRKQFSDVGVEGDFQVKGPASEKPDFEILVNTHPSLGKLIAQRNSAAFAIKSAQADFYPKLSAQAGTSRSGSHFLPQGLQLNAGLTLSLPLLEGGLRAAEVEKAASAFRQAQEDERSVKDGLIVALEQYWDAFQNSLENVGVEKKFLDAAEERSKISEAQYSLGLIQFDNWTIIQDDLVSQKKSYLNAQANALLAEANWIQAKGETLEYAD